MTDQLIGPLRELAGGGGTVVRGRARELAMVVDLIETLAGERGSALLIEGHPGIGKSTLLTAAAGLTRRRGIRTVRVAGSTHTLSSPWALASSLVNALDRQFDGRLVDRLHGPAGRALDLLDPNPAAGNPYPFVHGITCAVRDLALTEPLLLIVDDAHLADAESAAVLAALVSGVEDAPVGLLVARRPPTPPTADALIDLDVAASAHDVPRLWLDELDEETIRAIVADRLGEATGDLGQLGAAIVRAVGGNPLLARESADLCAGAPSTETAATVLADELDPNAAIIRRATLARLGAAGAFAGRVAAAISVLGGHANLEHVAAVADLSPEEACAVVDQLQRSDVIVAADGLLAVRHPLIEEMLLADVGELGRITLHAAAARALHAAGADDGAVVKQLLAGLGAMSAEPWMVATLRRAASRQVGLGSPVAAAELLNAALSLSVDEFQRAAVALDLARAEAAAGRGDVTARLGAIADDLAAAGSTFGPPHLLALAEIAEAQFATGEFAAAEQTCDQALGAFGLGSATVRRAIESAQPLGAEATLLIARLLVDRDSSAILAGHPSRLDATVDELVAEHRHAPPLAVRLLAAMRAGERAFGIDIPPDHMRLLIDTAECGEALPEALARPVYEAIGTALTIAGRPADAEQLLTQLIDDAADRGELVQHLSLLPVRGLAALQLGRLADASADAAGALDLAEQAPAASRYAAAGAIYVAAIAELERDRLEAARHLVSRVDPQRFGDSPVVGWFMCAAGRVALADGRPDDAAAAFVRAGSAFTSPGGRGAVLPWRSGLALARHALGDRASARQLVADEHAAAASVGDARLLAESRRSGAVLEPDHRTAAAMLADAADELTSVDAPLVLAQLEADRGCRLARAGDLRAARAVLTRAFERAGHLGATRLARITSAELERAGARRRAVVATGVDALTPAELRVARIAASGRSNRDVADALFVSLKTVESQLSAVYRKLGVNGRGELASALDF